MAFDAKPSGGGGSAIKTRSAKKGRTLVAHKGLAAPC